AIDKLAARRKVMGVAIENCCVKFIMAPKKYRIACPDRFAGLRSLGERTPAMKGMVPYTLTVFFGLFLASVNAWPALAQEGAAQETAPKAEAAEPAQQVTEIRIGYLRAYEPQLALSVV